MKKILLTALVLLFLLFTTFSYQYFKFNDGKLHLIFCNVGQGDGIFIRSPKGLDIIVDSGPDDSILRCLSSHMPFWDRSIELAFLTHPHADHMTGFIEILKRYRVLSFNTENVSNNTKIYKVLFDNLSKNSIKVNFLTKGDSYSLSDGVKIKTLGPSREFLEKTSPTGEINESEGFGNLITLVSYGNFRAILTGDSQVEGLKDAIFGSFPVEVLQIPHHGSKYGLNRELLEDFSPKLAVISVGKNKYGHPSPYTLGLLNDLKIKYLRTDRNGDVEIIINKDGQFKVL